MVAVPKATPVTNPVLLTVAMLLALVCHVQLLVTVSLGPLVKFAVTAKGLPELTFSDRLVGEIDSPLGLRTRAVTVRFVLPTILTPSAFSKVALIEVVPAAAVVASPVGASIVAKAIADELQAAVMPVASIVPSEYEPLAVNCTVFDVPAIEEFEGVNVIDCNNFGVTVSVVVADAARVGRILSKLAVTVSAPSASAVARPLLAGSLLTFAFVPAVGLQLASKVRSWVVLSEKVPTTVNCVVKPL
jgi:hypothetical protein